MCIYIFFKFIKGEPIFDNLRVFFFYHIWGPSGLPGTSYFDFILPNPLPAAPNPSTAFSGLSVFHLIPEVLSFSKK